MSEEINQYKALVLNGLEQGLVKRGAEHEVMQRAGMLPNHQQWQHFFDQLMLWLGVIFCGSSLIFFFAYNWDAMGKFAQFALAELAIVVSIAVYVKLDKQSVAGKACLLLASLFVGALLALVGQTYQTGADTYELFIVWAIAITLLVVLAQLAALWLFWLLLINVTVNLYFSTFSGIFGLIFGELAHLWTLFAINVTALVVWETLSLRKKLTSSSSHLQQPPSQPESQPQPRATWAIRVLLFASGTFITTLMLNAILITYEVRASSRIITMIVYAIFMGVGYWYYRHRQKDIFALAGGVLSFIVVLTALVAKYVIDIDEGGGFLLVGLVIIAQSALGAWWLKKVTQEVGA